MKDLPLQHSVHIMERYGRREMDAQREQTWHSTLLRVVLLCPFLFGMSGCGDETRFRPKMGGGLKRDAGDDSPVTPPPAEPVVSTPGTPTSPNASSPPSPQATVVTTETVRAEPPRAGVMNSSTGGAIPSTKRAARPRLRRPGETPQQSRFQLECNGQVVIKPLMLKKLLQAPGRNIVWMMTSSPDEDRARPPAVCLQFETEDDSPETLLGRRIHGRLFVQASANSQIFYTPHDTDVILEFSTWDDEGVEGRILPGEFLATGSDKPVSYTGTFIAGPANSAGSEGESE